MDNENLDGYLKFAKDLALRAGEIMQQYFRADSLTTEWKSDDSPVTIADLKINKLVIREVQTQYPEHGVLGEEESYEPQLDVVWVVDPIDGTAPFDLGMPNSTFCLALVFKGEVQLSVVLDPFTNRLFHAVKGKGTYLNDKKVTISKNSELHHSYAFVSTGTHQNRLIHTPVQEALREQGVKIITIPSFTYMALLLLEQKMHIAFLPKDAPWDAAAISLIVQEAGGVVSDIAGGKRMYNQRGNGLLLTTNPALHKRMIKLIVAAEEKAES